jgi:GH25 family lysozyme M1 (1,4-beta-N-acetylmuramidase)
MIKGIDVAKWQTENIDWPAVKRMGVRFVYVKATEGTYYLSPTYRRQITEAKAAGLAVGSYHFGNPRQSSGVAQARYLLRHRIPGDLPLALDMEWDPYRKSRGRCYLSDKRLVDSWIHGFLNTIGEKITIYTAKNWWIPCVRHPEDAYLWLAAPGRDPHKEKPVGWSRTWIHQYGIERILPLKNGQRVAVDVDNFLGNEEEFNDFINNKNIMNEAQDKIINENNLVLRHILYSLNKGQGGDHRYEAFRGDWGCDIVKQERGSIFKTIERIEEKLDEHIDLCKKTPSSDARSGAEEVR